MNKPGLDKENFDLSSVPLAVTSNLSSTRRLIVLIPDVDSMSTEFARQIRGLAMPSSLDVLFLGMCSNSREGLYLRRELVTLAAAIQDNRISVEIRIELGNDWIEKVKAILCPGDAIVCFAEQQVGLRHRPLGQVLNSTLDAPVYILSGFHPPSISSRSGFLTQLVSWAGSIGIILGFFWIQAKIDQLPKDWAHTTLLCLSVVVEIGMIWWWNSLTA